MAWVLRTPKGEPFAFPNDWRELLDYVQLKSGNKHAIETYVKFTDGSHIRHVYGNLYVAFDCYDKQICVMACTAVAAEKYVSGDTVDRPWFEIEDHLTYPPDCEHHLEAFEFSGGWSAKWVDDLSTLEHINEEGLNV